MARRPAALPSTWTNIAVANDSPHNTTYVAYLDLDADVPIRITCSPVKMADVARAIISPKMAAAGE